jgi:hypothetical protein
MGELTRKGEHRAVTEADLSHYANSQELQRLQQVPVLQGKNQHLFFAMFDGTGQDADDPQQEKTNIGMLREQVFALRKHPDMKVDGHYLGGIGTQEDFLAQWSDKAFAFSWDEQLEKMYRALSEQTRVWQQQDPSARISIVDAGYSRGAVLAAGLARVVDRYGIADPDDLSLGRDAQGNISVQSPHPPLVPRGEVAQAALLFDPVGTGFPKNYDARLPGSVISGTAFIAMHEQRTAFAHMAILDAGLSADRRFANLPVPGGHSNAGGGNRDPGLEAGTFNLSVDYLNTLVGREVFQYRALPDDPARYTSYQVRGVTAVPGLDSDGVRNLREELANCKVVDPCRDSERVDEALAARYEFRSVQVRAPVPGATQLMPSSSTRAVPSPADPGHPDHALLQQIRSGVAALDRDAGKPYDDASERLSRSLLAASKSGGGAPSPQNALQRVDHVVLGDNARHAFVVQGGLDDPAHRRAHVGVEQALRTPVEQSDARLLAANQTITQELEQARQLELQRQASPGHDAPQRAALAMP